MQLSQRERGLVIIGLLAVVLAVSYFYGWSPFAAKYAMLQQEVKRDRQTIQWLTHADQQIEQLRKAGAQLPNARTDSILVVVERLLQQEQLNVYVVQVQQGNESTVQLKLQDVPFDQLVRWLMLLWRQQQIRVQALSSQRGVSNGTVTTTVVLRTAAGAE